MKRNCDRCGSVTEKRRHVSQSLICDPCKPLAKAERAKRITLPCAECKVDVLLIGRSGLEQARRGRGYCSTTCRDAYVSRLSAERMARTNRAHASARMKANNPMARPEIREKMSATLRAIGHRPPVIMGNGRGPTVPQNRLAEALGWPIEVAIRTGAKKGRGVATCFKVDIASEPHKIAIEVDGGSHGLLSRQAEDRAKESILASLGWTVLRFSNLAVMDRLEECVQTVMSTISKLRERILTLQTGS